jgi:hypothetical protein
MARAQGGPPLLDERSWELPGAKQWEINLAVMPGWLRQQHDFQVPQLDLNYGVGSAVQLTFEAPYVLQTQFLNHSVQRLEQCFSGREVELYRQQKRVECVHLPADGAYAGPGEQRWASGIAAERGALSDAGGGAAECGSAGTGFRRPGTTFRFMGITRNGSSGFAAGHDFHKKAGGHRRSL